VTTPGIPNEFAFSTSGFGTRLRTIEDQAFAAVAMGFRKIELGLSDAPVPINGFEDTRRETGIEMTSVVAGCLNPRSDRMASSLLGSPDGDERDQALISVRRHIRLALSLECPRVVLRGSGVGDPKLHAEALEFNSRLDHEGFTEEFQEDVRTFVQKVEKKSQRQIEHLCRSLHTLRKEYPECQLALEPGWQLDDMMSFQAMGWVLEDLSEPSVGYWHDVGRIHVRERAGLPSQGEWLQAFGNRMLGVHLQDAAGQETEMPPGRGEVDFKLLAEYVPGNAVRVIEINQRHGRAEVLAAVQLLVDKGF
jgi:sugar phosphate isomerase/epimerase